MLKNGDKVSVKSCSQWADKMIGKRGNIGRVGKVGKEHVMIVNEDCTDIVSPTGNLKWGYWLDPMEATLTVIPEENIVAWTEEAATS